MYFLESIISKMSRTIRYLSKVYGFIRYPENVWLYKVSLGWIGFYEIYLECMV